MRTNFASALLLQGKFKEAQAEYEKWKDKPFGEQGLYKDTFLEDLVIFEETGIIPKRTRERRGGHQKTIGKTGVKPTFGWHK